MAIGWREIGGATYFFNGKGQMQAGRWLHLNDDWGENAKGNDYYLNQNGKMQTGGWFKLDDSGIISNQMVLDDLASSLKSEEKVSLCSRWEDANRTSSL